MRATVLLTLTLLAASAIIPAAQVQRSSLVLLATAGDYPGETYTAGPTPPAEFVFFSDEPIALDVSVANWGSAASALDRALVSRPAVRVTDTASTEAAARLRPVDEIWLDGVGGSEKVAEAKAMLIEPGDALRWRQMLDAGLSVPGFYRVTATFDASDERGEGIRPQRSEFMMEVRSRADALPAELARRVAEWLTARGESAPAQAATEALERVYPDSVAVHLIRSRLAEAAGDQRLARQELDVAAEFMRQDRDVLFRRYARPGQIEDLIDSLRP